VEALEAQELAVAVVQVALYTKPLHLLLALHTLALLVVEHQFQLTELQHMELKELIQI
jgi:hypothetical protein